MSRISSAEASQAQTRGARRGARASAGCSTWRRSRRPRSRLSSALRAGSDVADARDQVELRDRRRARARLLAQLVEVGWREAAGAAVPQHATLRARLAQATHQRARVDALQARHVPRREKIFEARARLPVVRLLGQLAHDQRRDPRPDRLVARVGDAVVADLRMGHHHHLAAVRRVGDDLLVAGDARVEDDLGGDVGRRRRTARRRRPCRPQSAQRRLSMLTSAIPVRRCCPARSSAAPFRAASGHPAASSCPWRGTARGRPPRPDRDRARPRRPPRPAPACRTAGPRPAPVDAVSAAISSVRLSAPACTSRISSPNAVSSPEMPGSAWSNSHALSIQRRGEWSVAMQSIVPSRKPSSSARRVGRRAQRRIGARVGVVRLDAVTRRVGQHQVVRRDLGGDAHAARLGAAHLLDRAGGAQVRQVQSAAGQARQRQVARDGDLLGLARDALEPEHRRQRAFVHDAAVDQVGVLGVAGRSAARRAASTRARGASGWPSAPRGRRPKTRPRRPSAMSAISDSSWPSRCLVVVPSGSTRTTASRRAWVSSDSTSEPVSMLGLRVGQRAQVVKPPAAAARVPLAMVSVSSKPGSRRWQCRSTKPGATTKPETSITVSPLVAGALDEPAVLDQHVADLVAAVGRIEDAAADQADHAGNPLSRYSSAMRTATPLVTCVSMTDCAAAGDSAGRSRRPRSSGPGA